MSLLQTSIYKYVLDLYCTEACLTGFRGARRDENMRMPANHRTSGGRRLARVAKEIVPVSDWNEV